MLGAILGFLGVVAGAVGSHGLVGRVPAQGLELFELAAQYQMYHALALLLVGTLYERWAGRLLLAAGALFLIGTILFSGSLYALVLTDASWVGPLTPIGGTALLGGWLVLAVAAVAARRQRLSDRSRAEPA
jgi:uncharacterized membrane protein YgdD (TMEM256/DUF423 family)